MTTTRCTVCHLDVDFAHTVALDNLQPTLREGLLARHPALTPEARVCRTCQYAERAAMIINRLTAERGTLSALEREAATKASEHIAVARHIDEELDAAATRGERIADGVARHGGSWAFVLTLLGLLALWVWGNAAAGAAAADPYPFILLNLFLSCIAALQAPVILMSQNRAAWRDRRKADQDFLINLKAEVEVATLHDKIDHLLNVQWQEMIALQELQVEMLRDLVAGRPR
jgi:uncharacterized membrane protein